MRAHPSAFLAIAALAAAAFPALVLADAGTGTARGARTETAVAETTAVEAARTDEAGGAAVGTAGADGGAGRAAPRATAGEPPPAHTAETPRPERTAHSAGTADTAGAAEAAASGGDATDTGDTANDPAASDTGDAHDGDDELAAFRGAARRRAAAAPWHPARTEDAIAARIAAHTPARTPDDARAWLPDGARARFLAARASVRESLADFDGARRDYARAIALGAGGVEPWHGLARSRVRAGEREAAEPAFHVAERTARETAGVGALRRADILRQLGELYLLMGFPEDAATVLDRALDLAPGAVRAQELWTLALSRSEGVEEPTALADRAVLWPPTRAERWRGQIERGLDAAFALAPPGLRARVEAAAGARPAAVLAGCLGLLALVLLVRRVLQRTGDLVVSIAYPDELRGHFSVRIATQPGRHRRLGPQETGTATRRRKSTRWCHYSVSRETHFLRLPARRYWVTVQGELSDARGTAAGGEVLAEPFEEQSIDVAGNETARVAFELFPRECAVDVSVLWDKRGAGEVGVVARGLPQSLRYQTNGRVRLRVPMGSHTIVVGSGDRVAECDVEVQSHRPTPVEINLADKDHLVFKGCPPAVEPYLHGDLGGAARALERDGHEQVAHLLLARLHQEQGQTERAAERLEEAGHHLEAAKLRESLSDFRRAAALFENAGNARRAAEAWRAAGEPTRAGELYQSIGDHALATGCFEEAGATAQLIGALEIQGRYFEAARIATDEDDRARAIRLLQQVARGDAAYGDACMQLVEAFEQEGHADLAARKLEEYVATLGTGASPDVHSRLADLLARGDEPGRALEVLEALREREPTYPNIASRIESLRKILSGRRLDDGAASMHTTATLLSDQRYEIVQEIGRGGMGLIFEARDRRLGRTVALKRLPENLREHPKAMQLFLNEAQAAARLNHPNIVTIYDTDQQDGTFFITMELLQGMPLNTVLRDRGRLGPRDTARIGAQVARGLAYAHDQQIVHRDIKTANLFLTHDKVVKIMDFGLAKIIEEVRRGSTVIGGTPSYMAPEQAAGDRVDHRADVYSLGVTLFELVTGRLPFDKGDVAYHHRHTPAPDPRQVAGGIPDVLAELILQMMQKDPDARCGDAREVEERLDRIVHPA